MLYAQVCVNTPLGRRIGPSLGADVQPGWRDRAFTYAVPESLAGRLQPGHLVWVQFRSRRLQAVVLSVTSQPPEFDTREIISLVWAQPVLTPAQLDLAHWISEYYLTPLIDALRMMLPVRITQRGRTVYVSAGDPHPDGLTGRQEALLRRLDEGEATWAEIKEELPKLTQAADLEPLLDMGLVTREVAFSSPPPRPKVERVVKLRAGASGADALRGLERRSPQADVLEWLAQQADPLPSQRELCAAVKCAPATLRALEAAGHVKLLPGEVLRRTVPEAALPAALAGLADEPALAAALAAAPVAPADATEWRARNSVTRKVLAALAKRDLIEIVTDEPAVMLLVPHPELPGLLRKMRFTDRHHRVLEALQAAGGEAKAARLYEDAGADLERLRGLEAAGLVELREEVVWRDPLAGIEFTPDSAPP